MLLRKLSFDDDAYDAIKLAGQEKSGRKREKTVIANRCAKSKRINPRRRRSRVQAEDKVDWYATKTALDTDII